MSIQAKINAELGVRLGAALVAALVSFVVGTIAVILVISATGKWQAVQTLRSGDRRLWWFVGGLCGALIVATASVAVPLIGVALLAVSLVAGQLAGGLVVDRIGIAPGGRRPITAPRVAGAVLAFAAVLLSAQGKNAEVRPLIIALVTAAGLSGAVQQAANGHLRRHADEVLVAVLCNFVVGTVALALVCLLLMSRGELGDLAWPGMPLWIYTGGFLGVVFVLTTTAAVRLLGVLRITLSVVAGQLLGALIVDNVWAEASRPSGRTYAAVVIVLIAVLVAGRASLTSRGSA